MSLEDKTESEASGVGCLLGLVGGVVGFVLGVNLADKGILYQIPVVEYFAKLDKVVGIGAFTAPFVVIPYYLGAAIQRAFSKKKY